MEFNLGTVLYFALKGKGVVCSDLQRFLKFKKCKYGTVDHFPSATETDNKLLTYLKRNIECDEWYRKQGVLLTDKDVKIILEKRDVFSLLLFKI